MSHGIHCTISMANVKRFFQFFGQGIWPDEGLSRHPCDYCSPDISQHLIPRLYKEPAFRLANSCRCERTPDSCRHCTFFWTAFSNSLKEGEEGEARLCFMVLLYYNYRRCQCQFFRFFWTFYEIRHNQTREDRSFF